MVVVVVEVGALFGLVSVSPNEQEEIPTLVQLTLLHLPLHQGFTT